MPRMMTDPADERMETGQIGGSTGRGFHFSSIKLDHLGATEYTLVTIAVDVTGSTAPFAADLRKFLLTAVASCKKSPRVNNLLLRVITFSSSLPGGVEEIHGFKPISEINPDDYPQFRPAGMTPLNDAAFSSVGATNAFAKQLMDQDFLANGIFFGITDGADNDSRTTVSMIAEEMRRGAKGEEIESLIGILVGINDDDQKAGLSPAERAEAANMRRLLETFAKDAGLQYVSGGDATPGRLAKVAEFVSQSVSSQSQSIGTGGPSQSIAATI